MPVSRVVTRAACSPASTEDAVPQKPADNALSYNGGCSQSDGILQEMDDLPAAKTLH